MQIYSVFAVLKFHKKSKLGKKCLRKLPRRDGDNEKKIGKHCPKA